ncbi:2'-deoxynucleoside 5'-phosphate N-hydrolase 1 [Ruminiclostridium hungatei]|uniref:2'-deoxynucleoside 5'-phosphate N-hydrolase 1 n=1 Tax=Ruminiclostridium hungatei TaxID=48256 RepID=A0A1V4SHB0_RUMHU|nr:nucleoside 2-deoxyribosyltransferase [Ruminiclostridium hungatei]OPX43133.1 2'-deoxynucleoside 5'-phosphate N-hydrolase 1 [Ruminiclostridium hungatei]
MKAYIGIKFYQDYRNRELIEKISEALEKNSITTSCVVRDMEKWGKVEYEPKELMENALSEIDSCDIVIIEFTEKGIGLGIESGYAFAKGVPIITIAQEGSEISNTLMGISKKIFIYKDSSELVDFFSNEV